MTVQILVGDCRERLAELPEKHFHTCVTSPPYFGLRDYGTASWLGGDADCDHKGAPQQSGSSTLAGNGHGAGKKLSPQLQAQAVPFKGRCGKCGAERVDAQIGLEPTPDEFVAALVEVFRGVRRVLRDDGTVWLNLGDSYASRPNGSIGKESRLEGAFNNHTKFRQAHALRKPGLPPGLKHKDLVGIPWMVAFALRADGWYLRQDVIWNKPNPMPESVSDRCTKAHEYVFLLSKSPIYYFDAEAIAEPRSQFEDANSFRGGSYTGGEIDNATMGKRKTPGNKTHKAKTAYEEGDERHRTKVGLVAYSERERAADPNDLGLRNKRSVWTVGSQPFKEAHFATYPPALIEPCILAGAPKGGFVLDPFGGAGTTGMVADRLGRNATLIELNPEYAEIAARRLNQDAGMFAEVETCS